MNAAAQPLLLLGVGGAGCALAAAIKRVSDIDARVLFADTDAQTGASNAPFVLLGGDRLSGRGAGGDSVLAKLAAEDSAAQFEEHLDGVRLAVVTACLGGGTGGGATPELLARLAERGIPSLVFATTPFSFEGDDRRQKARRSAVALEEAADASVLLSLDSLAGDASMPMVKALGHAVEATAAAASLVWRILEKPGYLKIDIERARRIISGAGRGRFAFAAGKTGEKRAAAVLDALANCPLLAATAGQTRSILCGILAGDDLRLAETGEIAEGVRDLFGRSAQFDLATVNDEAAFGGRVGAAVLLFESAAGAAESEGGAAGRHGGRKRQTGRERAAKALSPSVTGRGRFSNTEPTVWNGEDLDIPTYIRRNISLNL